MKRIKKAVKDISDDIHRKEKREIKKNQKKFKPSSEMVQYDNELKYVMDQIELVDRKQLPIEVQRWIREALLEVSHQYYCMNMDMRDYYRRKSYYTPINNMDKNPI